MKHTSMKLALDELMGSAEETGRADALEILQTVGIEPCTPAEAVQRIAAMLFRLDGDNAGVDVMRQRLEAMPSLTIKQHIYEMDAAMSSLEKFGRVLCSLLVARMAGAMPEPEE